MATDFKQVQVTIAESASLSGEGVLYGYTPVAIMLPAAWTAAGLSFQLSYDGSTFNNMYDTTGEVQIDSSVVGASRVIAVDPLTFAGALRIKVRSGTAAAAVTQAAERVITLICREY